MQHPKTAPIGAQLYTVRDALRSDLPGTVSHLAESGLSFVEGFRLSEFPGLTAHLESRGLTMPLAHERVVSSPDTTTWNATYAHAAASGVDIVIDPGVAADKWNEVDGIARTAERMRSAASLAREHGVRLGYHNHAHDLDLQDDGRTTLEHFADLVDGAVVFEIDVYWAVRAGVDPVSLISSLGDRVAALHLKDAPSDSTEVIDQVPLGLGAVPIMECIAAAPDSAFQIIEFDDSRWDPLQAMVLSRAWLEAATRR